MRDFLFITEPVLFVKAIKQQSNMIRLWDIDFSTHFSFYKCLEILLFYVYKAAV